MASSTGIADRFGSSVISAGLSAATNPAELFLEYGANGLYPIVIPSPDKLIEMYIQGRITPQMLSGVAAWHGINYKQDSESLETDQPRDEILGGLNDMWLAVIDASISVPSVQDILTLWNRKEIPTEKLVDEYLNRHGFQDYERSLLKSLANDIPGPGDLVHFVLRHGFEPSVIAANDLMAEFPQSARDWFAKQGLDYTFIIQDPFTNVESATTWAEMYWATHWVPLAPTQAYEMVQRLRPSRIAEVQQTIPGASVFTQADLARWLRINDFPPSIRANLAAIAYNPITATDARTLFRLGLNDQPMLTERLQDVGYNPVDADTIAKAEVLTKQRMRAAQGHGWTPSALASGYAAGLVPADLVSREMTRQGFSAEEAQILMNRAGIEYQATFVRRGASRSVQTATSAVINAYKIGSSGRDDAVRVLVSLGWRDAAAQAVLDAEDMAEHSQRIAGIIRMTRSHYLSGEITLEQAQDALTKAEVTQARIQEYLDEWKASFTTRRKLLSAGKVQRLYEQGILTAAAAYEQLFNLGFSNPDDLLLLQESQQRIVKAQVAARTAADKQVAKAAKMLADSAKAQQRQLEKTYASLRRVTPPGKLQSWLERDLINPQFFAGRMEAMGYGPQETQEWLNEALQRREERRAKLQSAADRAVRPKIKEESISTLTRWYADDIINEDQLRSELTSIGVPDSDLDRYVLQAKVAWEKSHATTKEQQELSNATSSSPGSPLTPPS